MNNIQKIELKKIVPVAAKISSGKSQLLNVLYNINFLESKAGIGTKFVNLLRYNPDIKQPIFYHLKLLKEDKKYIFYKDLNEVYEGEEKIIEANKKINQKLYNEKEIKFEELFYMIEINDSPFLKDKDYLKSHDLCDIPGLSEYQSCQITNEKDLKETIKTNILDKDINSKNNENINKTFEMETINNEKENEDDIYYKTKNMERNTYLTEIFGIIKDYIDGAIIILSIENYHFEDNYELIAKLHRVIQRQITNFLVILNKIDLSKNPEEDIKNCKGEIIKHFPKCQTFNINLNIFIPLSVIQVKNELLMEKNFKYLLLYHAYNFMSKAQKNELPPANNTFINHIKNILDIEKENNINDYKTKVKQLNKSDISEINISLNDLLTQFEGKGVNLGIAKEEIKDNDDDEDDDDVEEDNDDNSDNIYIFKLLYVYFKEKKLIPSISEETKNLLDYFKNENKKLQFDNNNETETDKNERNELINLMVNYLNSLNNNLSKSRIGGAINILMDEITETIKFLKIYNYNFIPFLGPSNAGKTTLINGIIGLDILPTDLKECTKRGIIIRYCNNSYDEMKIYKANFIEEKILDKTYCYLNIGNTIGKGVKQVSEILKGLNYEYTDNEEDYFYYISTKIKLFDEMGLNDNIKNNIYLIDFPGYGTATKFIEKGICKKIMGFSSCFIFIVRNSIIKENNTKRIIDNIFDLAKKQKEKIYSGIIKSCLFILNNDKSQTTSENDLDKAKKDIKDIITIDSSLNINEINLCFFNGLYYCDYCNTQQYFSDLGKTLEFEYNNYILSKNMYFKWPESFRGKKTYTFYDYFYKQLCDKIKTKYGTNIKKLKSEIINKDVENQLTIFSQLKNIKMDEILLKQNKIVKLLTYGKDKINDLNTLKESNIEDLKKILNSQFNYIYDNKKEELNKKINKIITSLDEFFKMILVSEKANLNRVEETREKINNLQDNLIKIFDTNQQNIKNILEGYKKFIYQLLNDKIENIEKDLKKTNYKDILDNIDQEIKNKLKDLNESIKYIIENVNINAKETFDKINKEVKEFSNEKIDLKIVNSFSEFILIKIGDKNKNLYDQLFVEIKSSKSLSKIYDTKGFSDFFKSVFSDYHYLKNNINIIFDDFIKKKEYIFKLLNDNLIYYKKGLLHIIGKAFNIMTNKFTTEQLSILKEIEKFYQSIRNKILDTKNKLCQNNY